MLPLIMLIKKKAWYIINIKLQYIPKYDYVICQEILDYNTILEMQCIYEFS